MSTITSEMVKNKTNHCQDFDLYLLDKNNNITSNIKVMNPKIKGIDIKSGNIYAYGGRNSDKMLSIKDEDEVTLTISSTGLNIYPYPINELVSYSLQDIENSLNKLGITTKEANGNFRTLSAIFQDLSSIWEAERDKFKIAFQSNKKEGIQSSKEENITEPADLDSQTDSQNENGSGYFLDENYDFDFDIDF